jgi:hypothetical protein
MFIDSLDYDDNFLSLDYILNYKMPPPATSFEMFAAGRTLEQEMVIWDREFARDHPVQNWVNEILFKGKTIFTYAPYYSLTHPWEIIADWHRELKYAWQRVFKGYDETIIWDIGYYLTEKMPLWLLQLKKQKHGIPSCYFPDEYNGDYDSIPEEESDKLLEKAEMMWDADIDKMIAGFKAHKEIQDAEFEWITIEDLHREEDKRYKIFKAGMKLFVEHYGDLWD